MSIFKSKFLVVGGTGSFGNQVVRHLAERGASEIRVLSRDEKKQDDMRRVYSQHNLKFFLGDVRDPSTIDAAIAGVDYIFHAAALKQVPSCEFFPIEAAKTNVFGTHNVLKSAIRHDVKRVVVLSTDKAVYPINAMGISKALMEKVMVAEARRLVDVGNTTTTLLGTRYGNVVASRGSVIPLFVQQIKRGAPITITEPTMTRYLMSLDDAVGLVFHAFTHGDTGDIFVQKSPAATIHTVALALMEILKTEVPIEIIGRRHGEKAHETLVSSEEMAVAVDEVDYYKIPQDFRSSNYSAADKLDVDFESAVQPYDSSNTTRLSVEETAELLVNIQEVKDLL